MRRGAGPRTRLVFPARRAAIDGCTSCIPHRRSMKDPSPRRGTGMSGRFDVRFVQKPWGHETIWAHTDRYVGKVLHIKAGHALSVQYHNQKDETIHLLRGEMIYRVGEGRSQELKEVTLRAGESWRNTPGM